MALLVVLALLAVQAQTTASQSELLDLPAGLLPDILSCVADDRVLALCSQTCRTLQSAAAGPLRFRRLLRGLAMEESDTVQELYTALDPRRDVRLPDLTADIPPLLLSEITRLSMGYPDGESRDDIDAIRERYPLALRSVFPNMHRVANGLLSTVAVFDSLGSPRVLRALHRYGILFDMATYMQTIGTTPDLVADVFPLLRQPSGSILPGFPLLDLLFSRPDPRPAAKLFEVPEFVMRFDPAEFLAVLDPFFRDRSVSLSPVLSLPCVGDLLRARSSSFDDTLLHMAFQHGRMDVAERLLELGAEPEIRNIFGRTAIASLSTDLESVTAFLSLLPRYPQLDRVLRANWPEFISVLNRSLQSRNDDSTAVVEWVLQEDVLGENVNVPAAGTARPLVQYVFEHGQLGLVPQLLGVRHFQLDGKDPKGLSPIAHLPPDSLPDFLDLARLPQVRDLLRANLPDAVLVLGTAMGRCQAHSVTMAMQQEWFPDLINVRCSSKGWTLLHYAAWYGRAHIAARLLSYPKIDKCQRNDAGATFKDYLSVCEMIKVTVLCQWYSMVRLHDAFRLHDDRLRSGVDTMRMVIRT